MYWVLKFGIALSFMMSVLTGQGVFRFLFMMMGFIGIDLVRDNFGGKQ